MTTDRAAQRKRSPETRAKISETLRGTKLSEERKAKIAAGLRGKPKSEAHKRATGAGVRAFHQRRREVEALERRLAALRDES